ncbi:MAG TPA: hypothetical protein VFF20_09105 [Pseudogracilibacillus sp.]|nr:hypothetical protein [Pseudogracilibacillus sp.]
MATIHKIRLTNIVYEEGSKRFNDEIFTFKGNNSAIVLENGGGKTVFIHTVLQAVLPHTHLGERKIKETLRLENGPAHIGIEWLIHEHPRRYATTVVSLYMYDNRLHSLKYTYDYGPNDENRLEKIPFVKGEGKEKRPARRVELAEYFTMMKNKSMNARTFDTNKAFHEHIEKAYHIVKNEWDSIVKINRDEGGIEQFFDDCKTTNDLFNRLLIPTVEDSIAGYEEGSFANIFEERREGFRMYHNLQNSLREYELIEEKINQYVGQFAAFSEKERAYEEVKQRAKAFDLLLEDQAKEVAEALASEQSSLEMIGNQLIELDKKEASYELIRAEMLKKELEASHLEKQSILEEAKETLDENERERASLRYAEQKANLVHAQEEKKAYEKELMEKDESGKSADLGEELEQVDGQIHGYYIAKTEALEKKISSTEHELRPLGREAEKIVRAIGEKEEAKSELEKKELRIDVEVETKKEAIEKIKGEILANPQQEDLPKEYAQWMKLTKQLNEAVNEAHNILHLKENELHDVSDALHQAKEKLQNIKGQRQAVEYEQRQLKQAHEATIEKLATIRPIWRGLKDLYLRQSTIINTLNDLEQERTKDRELKLHRERLAHRFNDDYQAQSHFFTDPLLYEKVKNWQKDLFIQTGTEYVAQLAEDERELAENYQLWPITIVTLAAHKQVYQEKITALRDELQHPLIILTMEEAKEITTSPPKDRSWITPSYWQSNLREGTFASWQAEMKLKATKATEERQEADGKVEEVRAILHHVQQFFATYPKEARETIEATIKEQERDKEATEARIKRLTTKGQQIKKTLQETEKEIRDKQDQVNGIEERLLKAQSIFQYEEDIRSLEAKQGEQKATIQAYIREITDLRHDQKRYETEIAIIQERIKDNKLAIRDIQMNDLYKKVRHTRPAFTDLALDFMRSQRERLEFEIRGIEQQHSEIRVRLETAINDIARTKEAMQDIVAENPTIDTEITFPVDGKSRIGRLTEAIHKGKELLPRLTEQAEAATKAFYNQVGVVKEQKETFTKQFPGEKRTEFTREVAEIAPYLAKERRKLTERKAYLDQRIEQITREENQISESANELERFKEAHHFHQRNITASVLTEEERTDFSYTRLKTVRSITKNLTDSAQALTLERNKIAKAKEQFRSFCRQQISDRKLREAAMEGMETKENYDDIVAYKQDMLTTLENARKHARYFIAKNDRDVQTFVNNIHNHLLNVTAELALIPKKTRVKTATGAKDIYHFKIPSWPEEEGKQRIREHLEWILSRLETDYYKDELGKEDTTKVRKQVETWLQTKALLQVVMKNEEMRISCRKVTNDNQVTSRLNAWERSNKWSGGEKWSKNMTLFLGLLNYVAEKKKQHNPNLKRNRAVILDNPFGKASSDHVLDPVFFIAEQLGFQIIALTAHADGKFLQDYFPIIYSLRLRKTAIDGVQVMATERRVHHAYFEDHEPVALESLEEREQLEFELGE